MTFVVVFNPGLESSEGLKEKIIDAINASISARFVPNEIIRIDEVPSTLSGKKLEVPIRKLLLSSDPKTVVYRDTMANPCSFEFFKRFARNKAIKVKNYFMQGDDKNR